MSPQNTLQTGSAPAESAAKSSPKFCGEFNIVPSSIIALEGLGNYVILHRLTGKPLMYAYTLRRFVDQLPGFLRVHKRYLINPAFLKNVDLKAGQLELVNGQVIPIARRQRTYVKSKLGLKRYERI